MACFSTKMDFFVNKYRYYIKFCYLCLVMTKIDRKGHYRSSGSPKAGVGRLWPFGQTPCRQVVSCRQVAVALRAT